MKNLRKYFNQNRTKIIITIAVIVFIIVLIQMLNGLMKEMHEESQEKVLVDRNKPTESVITGQIVSEEKTDKNTEIIKNFVEYCNQKQYDKAYSLLSQSCQNEFGNLNNFITNYCNKIFNSSKTYKIELWLSTNSLYTYRVIYQDSNLLATGGNVTNKNQEDYITVAEQGEERTLNINGFIFEEKIEKSQMLGNVEIFVNSKKTYKNYESYNITVKNYSTKEILLNNATNSISVLDKNNVKYLSFVEEIPKENLYVKSGQEKTIIIKFNKIYDSYRIITKMRFEEIIMGENISEQVNNEVEKMQIEIEL